MVLLLLAGLPLWGCAKAADKAPAPPPAPVAQTAGGPRDGARIYASVCSTCHQINGMGVRGAVPPLGGAAFTDPEVVVQVLLRGIDGPIRVGRGDYNGHMPSFASVLSDAEIAAVASHVRRTWGGGGRDIDAAFVAARRARVGDLGAWKGGRDLAATLAPGLPPQPAWTGPAPGPPDSGLLTLINEGRGEAFACSSCHGPLGQGGETFPRLAGLPAGYIAGQLDAFASGARVNDQMAPIARALSPAERAALGDYYSRARAPSTARPSLGGDRARGESLALRGDWSKDIPACFACHGPSGFGAAPAFPALAAQHPAYTVAQLAAWSGGGRPGDPGGLMTQVAGRLSQADRRAVADYLATLPPNPASPSSNRR